MKLFQFLAKLLRNISVLLFFFVKRDVSLSCVAGTARYFHIQIDFGGNEMSESGSGPKRLQITSVD